MAAKKPAKAPTKKGATKKAARSDKAEGPAAVAAVIRAMPPLHRAMAKIIDGIVAREVPHAKRAVKWGSPMWGVEGKGWFAAVGSFKSYVKVNFFSGTQLDPVPPEGEGKGMRSVNIASMAELDETQLAAWIRQAAAIPGWGRA